MKKFVALMVFALLLNVTLCEGKTVVCLMGASNTEYSFTTANYNLSSIDSNEVALLQKDAGVNFSYSSGLYITTSSSYQNVWLNISIEPLLSYTISVRFKKSSVSQTFRVRTLFDDGKTIQYGYWRTYDSSLSDKYAWVAGCFRSLEKTSSGRIGFQIDIPISTILIHSINGATLLLPSDVDVLNVATAGISAYQAYQSITNSQPIMNLFDDVVATGADLYIVLLGCNDMSGLYKTNEYPNYLESVVYYTSEYLKAIKNVTGKPVYYCNEFYWRERFAEYSGTMGGGQPFIWGCTYISGLVEQEAPSYCTDLNNCFKYRNALFKRYFEMLKPVLASYNIPYVDMNKIVSRKYPIRDLMFSYPPTAGGDGLVHPYEAAICSLVRDTVYAIIEGRTKEIQ